MEIFSECPYYQEYHKLTKEEKAEYCEPCQTEKCALDPNICKARLIWAYKQLKEEK